MANTYALAPSPKWYFLDAQGRPAAGGSLTTWLAADHSTPKFVFSDPSGLFPYIDPIILDATGGTPVPMYWDTTSPGLYYIVVKDAAGNLIFDLNNFPISGSGGVTPITTNIDIENHLINGQFLFIDAVNETDSAITPVPIGSTHIAPGSGFFKNSTGEYVSTTSSGVLSGWSFKKQGGTGVTDTIRFTAVTNIGTGFPLEPSANATRYFEYQLSAIGTAVTDAALENTIPNVELFSGELLTVSFESKSNIGATPAAFEIVQYFGTGGAPSASVTTSQAFNFTNGVWGPRQSFQITVPSVAGKNKGTNNDDALIFRWVMPLNTIGIFSLANLQIQRGNFAVAPYIEQTYAQDQYKVLIDLIAAGNIIYRTGDYLWSDNGSLLFPGDRPGWLILIDFAQTIGKSAASFASTFGLQYKNLYILWWTIYPQTECIVNGGRGATAIADFNADKRMTIPVHIIGSVFASVGAPIPPLLPHTVGQFTGEPTHVLTEFEMPSHQHTIIGHGINGDAAGSARPSYNFGTELTGFTGGNGAHNNMQPTVYKYLFVKL